MSNKSVKQLVDNAEGDLNKSRLTKTKGVLFNNLLYDRPLIEYLESDEQPHFSEKSHESITKIKNPTQKIERGKEGLDKLFSYSGSQGPEYLLITDEKVLIVSGDECGDRYFPIPYEFIEDVWMKKSRGIYVEDIEGHTYIIPPPSQSAFLYIKKRLRESEYNKKSPLPGDFHITSRHASNGQQTDFCEDGWYHIHFDENKISTEHDSQVKLDYKNIESVRLRRPFRASKNISGLRNGFHNRYNDALCLTLYRPDQDDFIHVFLVSNSRSNKNWARFHTSPKYLAISKLYEYIKDKCAKSNATGENFILKEWTENRAKLKIQEWDDRTVSTGPSMEGSIETEGKSRGTQIGPFIRSKSKSESEIHIEDSSISVDEGGYTEKAHCCIIYDDRIFVDTDPVIDIPYDDVERVMRKKTGIAIQFGGLTYSIIKTNRTKKELKGAVEFIKKKIQESTQKDQESKFTQKRDDTSLTKQIRELKELAEDGIITDEEFESKKQELLDQI